MPLTPRTRPHGIAKNTLFNLAGAGLPMVFALVTIPYVIRGLGAERFGVLALAWAVLGYFGAMDLGLGRAATKFVAEAIGSNTPEKIPLIAWSALRAQAFLGLVGGVLFVSIARLLVERVLKVPPELTGETLLSFYELAAAVPLVLVAGSLRGILEAAHRFDLVNVVRAPASSANSLLPALGVLLGLELPGIIGLLVLARLLAALVSFGMCLHVFPALRHAREGQRGSLRALLGYGGWVAVSSVVSPLLVYLDRFLIGSLLSISAVTYYSAPYEMVSRTLVISSSLAATLFPTFSALLADGRTADTSPLAARSTKYVLLFLGPILLVAMAFAGDIMRIWLGAEIAAESAAAFAILAAGVAFIAVAQIPYTLLQAGGRPDLTAKIHIVELPVHVLFAWVLINRWGIAGAATAWLLRAAIDLLLLSLASHRVASLNWKAYRAARVPETLWLLAAFGAVTTLVAHAPTSLPIRGLMVLTATAMAALGAWHTLPDEQDRRRITGLTRWWFARSPRPPT